MPVTITALEATVEGQKIILMPRGSDFVGRSAIILNTKTYDISIVAKERKEAKN